MNHLDQLMPSRLRRLPELAYNLWWSWNPDAREIFRKLDYPLWRQTSHNPVKMLKEIGAERLEFVAHDAAFLRSLDHVLMRFDKELVNGESWYSEVHGEHKGSPVAYFSAEFGLHNSLPIYSGGLGILAGDHSKEASDLGVPFVGVGFMYPQGYFRQVLPSNGWQEAVYQQLNYADAPCRRLESADGEPVTVKVPMGKSVVLVAIWQVNVGRTTLYLMDTDLEENSPWHRELSARLYSGDSEMRIRQEVLLGIGGVRVLRKLGIAPGVFHMNEGHSAFLVYELLREEMEGGSGFDDALANVKSQTVFTTHTPVPAGHDKFSFAMVEKYLGAFWQTTGVGRAVFQDLGTVDENGGGVFNMTALALRGSGRANGVSKLHGEVSREMWDGVRPKSGGDDVISHVTNGIHSSTWIASELFDVFARYLGPDWVEQLDTDQLWQRMADVPDDELWNTHQLLKEKLLQFLSQRARRTWVKQGGDATKVLTSGTLLDRDALTIGFARRFATYKRASLIFRDLERIRGILLDKQKPLQIVFAGKAHPADDPGKSLIHDIYSLAKHHQMGGRVAFIEDYDMHMARYLVQGVDVWLNTPIRPLEASGTSGQKAALNGIPHFSVLDGWWAEGFNGANGWSIESGYKGEDPEERDRLDSEAMYRTLEEEIIPLYYDRDRDGVPRGWVEIMKESIRSCAPQFSTRRMVKDYVNKLYVPTLVGNTMEPT